MADETPVAPRAPFRRLALPELEALATSAHGLIESVRDASIAPNQSKVLRRIPAAEACHYLGGISIDTLYRRLKKDPSLPQGTQVSPRRREFRVEEIHELQRVFNLTPKRPSGRSALTLACINFKGGVSKTTTASHLGQYLCLMGYRVLMVDLDAQASLTQMFGILAHSEVDPQKTARPYFEGPVEGNGEPNPDWTGTLASAIQKTYWPGLDLIASNLGLYGAEFSIASRIRSEDGFLFYRVLREGLDTVADDYDVILMDTAPSLSFINSNALYAAEALLITLPPAPLDVQSAALFYELIASVVRMINELQGEDKVFEFASVLLTRFRPTDSSHQRIASWIRTYLVDTFTNPMVQTVVLEKLGLKLLSLYEADPQDQATKYEGDKRAFERALEAMNGVNREIEQAIQAVWTRTAQDESPPVTAAPARVAAYS